MNISSNNMKWFSGYSLMNRLFSQKNGNKGGVSNQTGANSSGGVKQDFKIAQFCIVDIAAYGRGLCHKDGEISAGE